MNCFKSMFLALAFAAGTTASAAVIPTPDGEYISVDEAQCDICSVKAGVIENTRADASFKFELTNETEQPYELSFQASLNKREPAVLSLTVSNGSETVYEGTVEPLNTGSWTSFLGYKYYLGILPAGNLTMTMKVVSVADSYAGNFRNFAIRATNEKHPVTIPTAEGQFFNPEDAYLGGSATLTTPVIDFTARGSSIKFVIDNTAESPYSLEFRTSLNGGDAVSSLVKFTLSGNGYEEAKEITINGTEAWTRYNTYSCNFSKLPVGEYNLVMTILELNNCVYAGNFRDFKMTQSESTSIDSFLTDSIANTTEYYDVNGIRLQSEPTSGFFIMKKGTKFTKIVK